MIQLGRIQTLPVLLERHQGLVLGNSEDSVLLPEALVPEGVGVGDEIEVFVYTDTEDIRVATTERPLAQVGEFACLRVVDVSTVGAFLDWGLDKDLFVPFGRMHCPMSAGDWVVVGLTVHERTGRIMGSSILAGLFDDDVSKLSAGHKVKLLVYGFNPLGVQVVVQGRHAGLIFRDQVYRELRLGEELEGYVQQVREDHRLDITLRRVGRAANTDAEAVILDALEAEGGALSLHDKSSPQAIRFKLGLSKKAFKRAVGSLYRARTIELVEGGIRLVAPASGSAQTPR